MSETTAETITFGPPQEPAEAPIEEKPRDPQGRFVDRSTARLFELAREVGVPEDEIAASSPDELRSAIKTARLEQQVNSKFDSLSQAFEPKAAPQPAPVDDDKFDGEDDIAPQIVAALKKLKQENKALREEIANTERRRAAETFAQQADRAFADLGSDYEHLVGKGTRDDLDPKSNHMKRRQMVLDEAIELAGKNATGAQVLRKIKQAAEGLFGKAKPAPITRYTPEEWAEAGVALPSHRDDGLEDIPDGPGKAEAIVAAYLARNGKR